MSSTSIAEMFDDIAPRYDFLNHLLSFHIDKTWRRKTSRMVAKQNPLKVLDVATGTADLALALATRSPMAHIIGVDISEKMLEIGKAKVDKRGRGNQIELRHGDAASLPFEENTFDAVIVAFGVRNFSNLEAGLNEMVRVCQDQGMIAILEFSHPTNPLIKTLYRWYSTLFIPNVGRKISRHPDAYSYLPTSVEAFPSGKAFAEKLGKAGVNDIHIKSFTGGIATLYYGFVQKKRPTQQ